MVLAYHVIFGAYGFWLPNDPYVEQNPLKEGKPAQPWRFVTRFGE